MAVHHDPVSILYWNLTKKFEIQSDGRYLFYVYCKLCRWLCAKIDCALNLFFQLLSFRVFHNFQKRWILREDLIYRGYYMPARGYEFYLRVVNSISHSFAALTREISSWPREKIHIWCEGHFVIVYLKCNTRVLWLWTLSGCFCDHVEMFLLVY